MPRGMSRPPFGPAAVKDRRLPASSTSAVYGDRGPEHATVGRVHRDGPRAPGVRLVHQLYDGPGLARHGADGTGQTALMAPASDRDPSLAAPSEPRWPSARLRRPKRTMGTAAGASVTVSGRGLVSAAPVRVAWSGGTFEFEGWAGPWSVEERWWDPAAAARLARVQVVATDGTALLLACEAGAWWLEATYD